MHFTKEMNHSHIDLSLYSNFQFVKYSQLFSSPDNSLNDDFSWYSFETVKRKAKINV